MEKPKAHLTATTYKEARELAESFKQIQDMEAWQRLRRFVQVMQLQAGQRALNKPDEVAHWASWAQGVAFMLNVVEDAVDKIEVFEDDEEEIDYDISDFISIGNADPG